ncbi:MAG: universal stress protein [Nitrospirae bacterium]|nr:universal stress protein [Nitrospirota bacterium]
MKKLTKKLEDIMSAAAFAEAGEFETAREIIKGKRRILLALRGDESDVNAFRYALSMCKRINAGLDILYVSESAATLLNNFKNTLEKEGVNYVITEKTGCVKKEIIDYTEKRKDIQFVVIESSEVLNIDCKQDDGTLSDAWRKLKCPLVLVSKGASPSMA